mmetsp:Transcript_19122/g.48576  ORF Transcript_19122/g.48576 Transcript_19122/m.48576 type:complete len:202 (-) Transcript_19122:1225-1830(-)
MWALYAQALDWSASVLYRRNRSQRSCRRCQRSHRHAASRPRGRVQALDSSHAVGGARREHARAALLGRRLNRERHHHRGSVVGAALGVHRKPHQLLGGILRAVLVAHGARRRALGRHRLVQVAAHLRHNVLVAQRARHAVADRHGEQRSGAQRHGVQLRLRQDHFLTRHLAGQLHLGLEVANGARHLQQAAVAKVAHVAVR